MCLPFPRKVRTVRLKVKWIPKFPQNSILNFRVPLELLLFSRSERNVGDYSYFFRFQPAPIGESRAVTKHGVRCFGRIRKRICDLRSFGSCRIKKTDESLSRVDSSVPLLRPDPNDLRSQIRFRIVKKKKESYHYSTGITITLFFVQMAKNNNNSNI